MPDKQVILILALSKETNCQIGVEDDTPLGSSFLGKIRMPAEKLKLIFDF